VKNRGLERVGLLVHYGWYGALMFCHMSPLRALLYFAMSQMMCGLLLALVFGLGHNGMEVYDADKRPDFWKLQVSQSVCQAERHVMYASVGVCCSRQEYALALSVGQVTTTRNVKGGALVQWFCGGLGYQVDHHLFPSIPRHNLGKLHVLVESFCKVSLVYGGDSTEASALKPLNPFATGAWSAVPRDQHVGRHGGGVEAPRRRVYPLLGGVPGHVIVAWLPVSDKPRAKGPTVGARSWERGLRLP
jgi:hypothetical protein